MIDLQPIPDQMNIPRDVWLSLPQVIRDETVRAWQELSSGIAKYKDKRCSLSEADADSFTRLHELDMSNWRRPNASRLTLADEMRDRLAPHVERMRLNDELEPYHVMAEAGGTTVADALHQYIEIESVMRHDHVAGFEMLARKCDIDLAAVATKMLETDTAA